MRETVARRAYDNTTLITAANLANLVTRPKRKQPSQATRSHTMIQASQQYPRPFLAYVLGSEPRRAATRLKHSWLEPNDGFNQAFRPPRTPPAPPVLFPRPSVTNPGAQQSAKLMPSLRRAHLPSFEPTPFCAEASWLVLASLGVSGLSPFAASLGKTWPPACQALGAP